jgi:hypothetical protein
MAIFDLELNKKRADQKYKRSHRHGNLKAMKNYMQDLFHNDQLAKLAVWCEKKKIDLQFVANTCDALEDNMRIVINSNQRPETQVYGLLHECGHFLIGQRTANQRFGFGYSMKDGNIKRSFKHRLDVLDEEIEAWRRGRSLADRLELQIDQPKFDKLVEENISTYLRWVLKNK